jgi:hypothetical protein
MERFTKEEDVLHSERIRNAKNNPKTIDEVLDYHLLQAPCRLTEIERKCVINAMNYWKKFGTVISKITMDIL